MKLMSSSNSSLKETQELPPLELLSQPCDLQLQSDQLLLPRLGCSFQLSPLLDQCLALSLHHSRPVTKILVFLYDGELFEREAHEQPLVLCVKLGDLREQRVQLPPQLLGLLSGGSAAHQGLQQLQDAHYFGHHPDQRLAAEPFDDLLKLLSESRRYVVHVHDGQLRSGCSWPVLVEATTLAAISFTWREACWRTDSRLLLRSALT
ncbi:hypothetical protein EYF80_035210 [Liparis tanakae]|uniref:Uncharacterized protein n=1 Tax=Liparis tanakae TaxID=230148 RepID=A0A4Z2GMX5_9TELE|nr:hypothetical protein EYF80_035210 [Liparis tanakae]